MGIFSKNKEIVSVFKKNKVIVTIYKGLRLVWQSIRSCFGAGYWVDEKPWVDDEGWKD